MSIGFASGGKEYFFSCVFPIGKTAAPFDFESMRD